MSIKAQVQPAMESEKHRSKSEKKHKSSHGEKKRKRDHEETGEKRKSKKHRADEKTTIGIEDSSSSSEMTPFQVQTSSLYLPLSPISQKYPIEGLCAEHLSPQILQWYPPFNGVILSYSNPRLSAEAFGNDGDKTLLQNVEEYAVSWAWMTAEFLLFKPNLESVVEGYVNLQNEGHLGLVCWNLFNASIERKRLPADWKWIGVEDMEVAEGADKGETYAEDGAGYFVDGEGNKVGGTVKFRIIDVETDVDREKSFMSLAGTMLEAKAERALADSEKSRMKPGADRESRRIGGLKGPGVTRLDAPAEE